MKVNSRRTRVDRLVACNMVPILALTILLAHQIVATNEQGNPLYHLANAVSGPVFVRGSEGYDTTRPVHNGACRHIFPLAVVRPWSTDDVAKIVQFATKYGYNISVRSGGHSYQCQGVEQDAIHVDLRSLNVIKFYPPHQVTFGSGANWEQVLKVVDPKKYTLVHAQAKTVGVGGFLLGVGVNTLGTTPRHGFGADNVIEYTIVLADGSVALVNDYNTTIIQRDGRNTYEVYDHTPDTDLRFAMRGSGASYGIVTEFKYKVYPHPETRATLVMAFLKNSYDLDRLFKAAQNDRYAISVIEPIFLRRPKPAILQAWGLIKMPQFMKTFGGKRVEPTVLSVVDLYSNNGKTDPGPALAYVKSQGLEVAFDNARLLEQFGLNAVDFTVEDQDSVYLTHQERKAEGYHALASANFMSFNTFRPIEETFLHHPVVGKYNRKTPSSENDSSGCDFCLFVLHIGIIGKNDNIIKGTKTGPISYELTCSYNANDRNKAKKCPAMVQKAQRDVIYRAKKYGERPRQYVNTPGCDADFYPFGERYWGNDYQRLVKIKNFWDPSNVFNFCHSVGSTDENCCVAP